MKFTKLFSVLIFLVLIFAAPALIAQDPPPPPTHGQTGNAPAGGGAPIGGGLIILTVLGAAWGYKKFRQGQSGESS